MANGVNVKMGVTGIAQFKQNMQTAKNSLKTVDEQLKLNEKQFKATGDAEAYMQQKSELLKTKLEEQRTVVEQAEKALAQMTSQGVDKSSKAFQSMQQQLARAKGELLDTQMEIQGVEVASDDAAAGISDMASELQSIGTQVSFQTVTEGLDRITEGLKNAAKRAFQMGEQLVRATLGAGAWADELATTATIYKGIDPTMTPEKLQRMRKTADLIDTNVESIINSKQKLATAMGKKDIDQIFAEFGIQNTRYGEIEDLNELFWKTGEALMNVQNEAKRAEMGKKIFGDWTALIPLFEAGREEYEKTMESQSVVSQKAIDNLTKMDDQYQKLQNEIETLKMEFLGELSPATTKVMESLTGMVEKFNEYIKSEKGQEFMSSLTDNIEKLFSSITNFDPEDAVKKVGDVMGTITKGFKWISQNWQSVETGLMAIAGGWAAIKAATFGLKIAELVKGLQRLGVGGAGGAGAGAGAGAAGSGAASAAAGAGETTAAAAAGGGSLLAGIGGIAAIISSFIWAADRRKNTPELVRGTDENLAAEVNKQSENLQNAFTEYVKAQKAVEDYELSGEWDEEVLEDLMNKAQMAQDALYALEGHEDILKAYSDWRQEHSYGNMDWILPDNDELFGAAETIGENTAIGLANGIDAGADEAIAAAQKLAEEVKRIIQDALQIKSPSKVMMRLGEFVSEGFAEGIENGYGRVSETMDRMSQVATTVSSGNSRGTGGGSRMIDVTLMIGPDKLTEVIVPLVDSSMGEEINLMRR